MGARLETVEKNFRSSYEDEIQDHEYDDDDDVDNDVIMYSSVR